MIKETLSQHSPYVDTSECEFGDHSFWECSCGWKAADEYGNGGNEFVMHIAEVLSND